MKTPVIRWGACFLLLTAVALGVHFLCRHYGGYLQSEDIGSTQGIERFGLYLLYPGFLPATFIWPGAHAPGWWGWLEGYNILLYCLAVLLVCRRVIGKAEA